MDFPGLLTVTLDFVQAAAAFVVALSIIVAVHEYGHYIVGRWSGIHAEVFSLGFGPKLWSRVDKRGTRWQVAAVPFGGYVKFLGDANAASAGADEDTMARLSDAERRHTMHGAPLWARAATVFAGPFFNFILSILVFAAMPLFSGIATEEPAIASLRPLPVVNELAPGDRILSVNGLETPDYAALNAVTDKMPKSPTAEYLVLRDGREMTVTGPTPQPPIILSVQPKSAAQDAGLEIGDVIVAMNGVEVPRFVDLQEVVRSGKGASITLTVWRDGQTFDATLTPRPRPVPGADGGLETAYLIGISSSFMFEPATRSAGYGEALQIGLWQTYGIIEGTFTGISSIIAGSISSCNINGPIAIAQATSTAASAGIGSFVWMIAALSTAIGLLNLFPIPVLDGGHLVFHAYEWARGRPPSDAVMNAAMTIGLTLVLALMLFGLGNDLFCV